MSNPVNEEVQDDGPTPHEELAMRIVDELLCTAVGSGHRMAVMQKLGDGTERNLGGRNRSSAINAVLQVLSEALVNLAPKRDTKGTEDGIS